MKLKGIRCECGNDEFTRHDYDIDKYVCDACGIIVKVKYRCSNCGYYGLF